MRNKTDIYIESIFGTPDVEHRFIKDSVLYIPMGNRKELYKVITLQSTEGELSLSKGNGLLTNEDKK